MGTVAVTGPDGRVHEVDMPAGKTEGDATAYIAQTEYGIAPPAATSTRDTPPELSLLDKGQNMAERALPMATDVVGSVLKGGLFDVVDAPANLANLAATGVQKLTGSEEAPWNFEVPTERVESENPYANTLADAKDYFTGRTVPEGQSKALDSVNTAAEWGAGMFNPANVSKKVDAAMGVTAGIGDYIFPEGGEMAGMFPAAASIVQALRGKGGGNIAGAVPKPDRQAVTVVDELLGESKKATQTKLARAIADKEVGTLADLTDSPAIYNLEATQGPQGTALKQEIAAKEQLAADYLQAKIGEVVPDAPLDTSVAAAVDRIEGIKTKANTVADVNVAKQIDTQVAKDAAAVKAENASVADIDAANARANALRSEADAGQAGYNTQPYPEDASKTLSSEYGRLEAEKSAVEKAAWSEFEAGGPIDVSDTARTLRESIEGSRMSATDQAKMSEAFKPEFEQIEKWADGPVNPNEIQSVLRDMKQKISDRAASNTMDYAHSQGGKIIDALEASIAASPSGEKFKAAKAATVAKHAAVNPEKLGKIRNSPNVETFSQRVNFKGQEGANTARLVKESGDPQVVDAAHDTIRAAAKQGGVDEKFIVDHNGYLNAFPKLKAELQKVADAEKTATTAESVAGATEKRLTRAMEASEKTRTSDAQVLKQAGAASRKKAADRAKAADTSLVAKYGENPNDTVKGLMNGKDASTTGLKRLHENAKKTGDGGSFRANVKEQMMAKLFPDKGTGHSRFDAASVKDFNKVKQSLVDSGVLTSGEANKVSELLATTIKRQQARKAAGKAAIDPKLSFPEQGAAIASALAITGTFGVPHALLVTPIIRRTVEKWMKSRKLPPAARTKIDEFLVHPEKYQEASDLMKTFEKGGKEFTQLQQDRVLRAIVGGSQAVSPE